MTAFAESAVGELATGGGLTALAGAILAAVKLLIDWSERRAAFRAAEEQRARDREDRRRQEDAENNERRDLLLREMITTMVRFEGTLARAVDGMAAGRPRQSRNRDVSHHPPES